MTVDLVIRNGRVVPPGGVIRRNTGGRCEVAHFPQVAPEISAPTR
jgi:hypothetical protein